MCVAEVNSPYNLPCGTEKRVEMQFYSTLNSALDGRGLLASRPSRFTPRRAPVPDWVDWVSPHGWSGKVLEKREFLNFFELRTVHSIDCTTPATAFGRHPFRFSAEAQSIPPEKVCVNFHRFPDVNIVVNRRKHSQFSRSQRIGNSLALLNFA